MRSPRRLSLSLGLVISAGALFAAVTAESAPPDATASAAPSASASASNAPPPLPLLRAADIPADASPEPQKKEWETGKQVRPTRYDGAPCTFTLVREWLRVACTRRVGGTLVAGDPADVKIAAFGNPASVLTGMGDTGPGYTSITFRIRRGDTKVFSLMETVWWGYNGAKLVETEKIALVWREGREDPVLLVGLQ